MSGARVSRTPSESAPQHVRLIMAVRRQHHWTQRELAWEMGVHVNTVKRWESGQRAIHPAWLKLITALLV